MENKFVPRGSVEKSIDQEDAEYQSLVNFVAKLNPMLSYEVQDASMELLTSKSFLPQVVGLCFFHSRMTPTFLQMKKLKVKSLCNTVKRINGMTLEKLVAHVMELNEEIGKYGLAMGWNSLTEVAWMFTMDALFSNFLGVCAWMIWASALKLVGNLMEMKKQFKVIPFFLKPKETEVCQSEVEAYIIEGAYDLLHLIIDTIKRFLKPSSSSNRELSTTESADDKPPSVESLQEVGIKFKPSTNGEVMFQNRWFTSSILYLPHIRLDEDTEPVLRNLMMTEYYTWPKKERVICHFMKFMNYLICGSIESVVLLRNEQIMTFSNLCKEKTGGCGQFGNVARQLKKCHNKYRAWCSQFGASAIMLPVVAVAMACLFANGLRVLGIKIMLLLSVFMAALLYLLARLKAIEKGILCQVNTDNPSSQKANGKRSHQHSL